MATQTQKPIQLTEDREMIKRIDNTANEWLYKLNAVVDAWKNLGITVPFSIEILTEQDFNTWFFNYTKSVNPVLSAIRQDAYQFPDDALMIDKTSNWLRDPETRLEGMQYIKLSGEYYELNVKAIEQAKNRSARQFAETENQQRAVELARKLSDAYNDFLNFVDSGINGDYQERIAPFAGSYPFLKWVDGRNVKGDFRHRVSINPEQFTNHGQLTQLLKNIR